ncbi:S49 family peptidase [Pseudaestuariivita rosea]|uniref:S49 family peptidase n=1 Tax=Pseudaestuariivita rosea TaxID=2763263 RepID=UPI001ABB5AE8|nr:S49 family peptidase [Pseudaestuariivita rosea]
MKRWIPFMKSDPVVSVVRLNGMIASGPRGLSDDGIAPVLEKAFSRGKPKAVAIVVNSPGGSPVQSSLIGARIRRLAQEKEIPVYAFVEDVAASGGYWLASAADEIWLDQASVVGSIGVISAGFGLHELIEKHGIQRRVYTAGKSKSMLDPFRPEKTEDVERLKRILEQIHQVFIDHVQSRRANKLPEDQDMFTGEIWVGEKAVDVGLAEGIGHLVPKMKEVFGDKVRLVPYGPRRSFLQRFGANVVGDMVHGIEERAQFARFGL